MGREPLIAVMADHGCEVVATDMDPDQAAAKGWLETGQYAQRIDQLNEGRICEKERFKRLVGFRIVDMNDIPGDLNGFDFTWSSCALEHLGTLEAGISFVKQSLNCLVPGGVAVHTTEYNVTSNDRTIEAGDTVIYRRRDIEDLARWLVFHGHQITLNFNPGDGPHDSYIDVPPYTHNPHLKLKISEYTCTSIGLLIRKAQ